MKLTKQQQADLELIKVGRRVAKKLKHGYAVVGVGPGVLFSSPVYSRYPLDMPTALVMFLDRELK